MSLTGYQEDEERGAAIDPRLDNWLSYESDYLPQPALSFHALERRHAAEALCDRRVPLLRRVGRAKRHLLDPTFEMPQLFVADVIEMARQLSVEELYCHHSRSAADHDFDVLELALARCAPKELVALHQRILRHEPSPEGGFWRAIRSPSSFLIAEAADREAIGRLRNRPLRADSPSSEGWARTSLLLLEIFGRPSLEQARLILGAGLDHVELRLLHALDELSLEDAEQLFKEHGDDAPVAKSHILMSILFRAPINESKILWDWLTQASMQDTQPHRGLLFRLLTTKDRSRFGEFLETNSWSWAISEDQDYVNHYGSLALIAATTSTPFEQLVPRLAPWMLVKAARDRGSLPVELNLAATVLGRSILNVALPPEISGALITVDKTFELPAYSLETRGDARVSQSTEERRAAHHHAIDEAISRIDEARKAGSSLLLRLGSIDDMRSLVLHAPLHIDAWLEDLDSVSVALRHRITLAKGLYLALCEVLLDANPERGVRLWHAIMRSPGARYVGLGKVDEALLMLFRVPNSSPVFALREELLEFERCENDSELSDLAFAALAGERRDWLDSKIAEDRSDVQPWRKLRAICLGGFTIGNAVYEPVAWPSGEIRTSTGSLLQASAHSRVRDASAREWWRSFLRATTNCEAHAAWVLFKASADRRAHLWMLAERQAEGAELPLQRLKDIHLAANRQELESAIERRDDDLAKHFLGRQTYDGLQP